MFFTESYSQFLLNSKPYKKNLPLLPYLIPIYFFNTFWKMNQGFQSLPVSDPNALKPFSVYLTCFLENEPRLPEPGGE
jgi:hypothetical protein